MYEAAGGPIVGRRVYVCIIYTEQCIYTVIHIHSTCNRLPAKKGHLQKLYEKITFFSNAEKTYSVQLYCKWNLRNPRTDWIIPDNRLEISFPMHSLKGPSRHTVFSLLPRETWGRGAVTTVTHQQLRMGGVYSWHGHCSGRADQQAPQYDFYAQMKNTFML
jgi:hypothetical protein